MAAYVPVGLSYLVPTEGTITISANEIYSASGKKGPLTLKITNTSTDTVAVVGYSNPYVPITGLTYFTEYDVEGKMVRFVPITIIPGVSATGVTDDSNSTPNWAVGETFTVYGSQIGGTSPENDLTFSVVQINQQSVDEFEVARGYVSVAVYDGGVIPGEGGLPTPPEPGLPTQTIIVGGSATEFVQIPGSLVSPNFIPLVVNSAGASVYITPVEFI